MSTDLYRRFKALLPDQPLLAGTITEARTDKTATVTLPGGGVLVARNPANLATGTRVFVRDGLIEGEAPNLPYEEGEI